MWIITGMHRSGTSLLARLFFEARADMGDPATFQEGDRWNPDGYFEQKEIISLNMRLIHGPFWKFSYFRLPSVERIMRRGEKSSGTLKDLAARYDSRVVKDTRFCLTLPAWRAQGARVQGVIACLREPTAVAASLKKRNRISLGRGLRLWTEHISRLLASTEDVPFRLVLYRSLIDRDLGRAETAGAFRFAGLSVSDGRLSEIRSTCVKPEMDHNPPAPGSAGPEQDIWEQLLRRHAAQAGGPGKD